MLSPAEKYFAVDQKKEELHAEYIGWHKIEIQPPQNTASPVKA